PAGGCSPGTTVCLSDPGRRAGAIEPSARGSAKHKTGGFRRNLYAACGRSRLPSGTGSAPVLLGKRDLPHLRKKLEKKCPPPRRDGNPLAKAPTCPPPELR